MGTSTKIEAIASTQTDARILKTLDEQVRRHDIKGAIEAFEDVAPDALDGYAMRHEVDDLVRRRLLRIHRYSASEIEDEDRLRDPQMCGTRWTVEVTQRLVQALWPESLSA